MSCHVIVNNDSMLKLWADVVFLTQMFSVFCDTNDSNARHKEWKRTQKAVLVLGS